MRRILFGHSEKLSFVKYWNSSKKCLVADLLLSCFFLAFIRPKILGGTGSSVNVLCSGYVL